MEHAGYVLAEEIVSNYDKTKNILLVCGRGNNGGDGFVIARILLLDGYLVNIISIGSSSAIKGYALVNFKILNNICEDIFYVKYPEEVNILRRRFLESDVIELINSSKSNSSGMEGAAILSCSAAMRTGVGLVKLFIPKSLNNIIKNSISEIITVLLDEIKEGVFGIDSVDTIL